jgi:hypothetical protein
MSRPDQEKVGALVEFPRNGKIERALFLDETTALNYAVANRGTVRTAWADKVSVPVKEISDEQQS